MEYRRNGFNGLQAYKKVYGRSGQTAEVNSSRLLSNAKVKARLDELGEKDSLRYGIDMENLVKDLAKIKERGLEEYGIYNQNGEEVGSKPTDMNASLKAIDTLIKIAGEYAPTKTDNTNKDEITFKDINGLDINIKWA